jgi:hypothetical protein
MNDTRTPHKVQLEITWESVIRILMGVWLAPKLEPDTVKAHEERNAQ